MIGPGDMEGIITREGEVAEYLYVNAELISGTVTSAHKLKSSFPFTHTFTLTSITTASLVPFVR